MKSILSNIIGGLFILLFTYTALSKLAGYARFRFVLSTAPLGASLRRMDSSDNSGSGTGHSGLAIYTGHSKKRIDRRGVSLIRIYYLPGIYDTYLPQFALFLRWRYPAAKLAQHIAFNIFFITAGLAGIYLQNKELNTPAGV